jgi:putative heme iron utilization protein
VWGENMFSPEEKIGICEHMNADHHDALLLYLQVFADCKDAVRAELKDLNAEGMEIIAWQEGVEKGQSLWVPYSEPLASAQELRPRLVSMVQMAREFLNE